VIFLFKIGRLTVNRVLDFHDDYGAISSAPTNQYQSQRGHVPIGLHMIKHSTDGPLFFEGDRVLRVVAYDVSSTSAVVHADGLGLLPIHFYITFADWRGGVGTISVSSLKDGLISESSQFEDHGDRARDMNASDLPRHGESGPQAATGWVGVGP
jgi:hypothetical protein